MRRWTSLLLVAFMVIGPLSASVLSASAASGEAVAGVQAVKAGC